MSDLLNLGVYCLLGLWTIKAETEMIMTNKFICWEDLNAQKLKLTATTLSITHLINRKCLVVGMKKKIKKRCEN